MTSRKRGTRNHYGQLYEPPDRPFLIRMAARAACYLLVGSLLLVTRLITCIRPRGSMRKRRRPARVVLTGTFFADNWVEAHVRPLAISPHCEYVWVVSDRPFVPIAKTAYVCPPAWLKRLIGRVPARSLYFAVTALRQRATIVGGFHLLLNGLVALPVARLVGATAVWFCVGGWAEVVHGGVHGGNRLFNRIARKDHVLERLLLAATREFNLIVTMGTRARQYLCCAGVTAPIEVVAGGIDEKLYEMRNGHPTYDLITVSRIAPVKRMDVFLQVVRSLAQCAPNVAALVVGGGEELNKVIQQRDMLGLSQRVSFIGQRRDVHRWLPRARVFVLTSDSEGLALSLIEAMMAGLPAVVSDVGDMGDLVENSVNGWRVPPEAVQDFADHIIRLLTDRDLYERCAVAARRSAMAYAVSTTRDRWDTILSKLGFQSVGPRSVRIRGPQRLILSRRALWESTSWIRRAPGAPALSVVHPRWWLGGSFRRNLRSVERAQQYSRDEAAAWQLARIRRIIALAYERSSYYRHVFRRLGLEPGDVRSLDDLRRLPMIDAKVVRENLSLMSTSRVPHTRADYISTGGTDGRPLAFYIDADRSPIEYAYLVASWTRAGYRLGIPLAVLRGRVVSPGSRGLRHEYDPFLRHHYYSTFHMNDDNICRYLEHVRTIGPCFLHVYPSSAAMLARFIRSSGVEPPPNICGIIAESEIVYPDQRQMTEEVFGCRLFSCYGHSEKLVLAVGCEHSNDYHVWPTYGYFELLDEAGQPVTTPGQRGEIVSTGFINVVMPFIRYRTGDYATYVGDHCKACGRQHPVIRDIRGHRMQEVLVAADRSEIPWAALNMHDDTFRNVRQFQFFQVTPGKAQLRIVPTKDFCGDDLRRIHRRFGHKLEDRLTIAIELVQSISPSPCGKAVYVDRRGVTERVALARPDP